MTDRSSLINELVSDLEPVTPAGRRLSLGALLWLGLSAAYVALMTLAGGPLREGAGQQLLAHPRFLAECLLGVAAILLLAQAGFASAVPGAMTRKRWLLALGVTGLWLLNYPLGLFSPALEPSMLGKRPHCYLETLVLALPPALLAAYLLQRLYPLRPLQSAALMGFTAGMLPALCMQLACMYEPGHILMWHLLPGALVGLLAPLPVAAVLGWRARRA